MKPIPYEAADILFQAAGYRPSPEQERIHRALLEVPREDEGRLPRLVVVGGGLQAGKSYLAGYHILARWPVDEITWLVGNRYQDTKREYQYVRDAAIRLGYAETKDCSYGEDGPWVMRFRNGHTVKTLSSDDPTRLASEAPDGIVLCEPGRQSRDALETSWERVVPKAGWCLVIGTFERASGWFSSLWRECQGENEYHGVSISLPSYSNRFFYPRGEQDPKFQTEWKRAKADPVGWSRFQERFLGIPRVPHDLVFPEFARKVHVRPEAEYVPGVDVHLAVDPGYSPSPAVVLFLQVVQGQVHVFDEIYLREVRIGDLISIVEQHHAFPAITRVVMDPYGGVQHGMGADAAIETWRARLGSRGVAVVTPVMPTGNRPHIQDRNSRVHDYLHQNPMLQQPGVIFAPRCTHTILELEGWIDDEGHERGYRYHVQRDGQIRADTPAAFDDHAVSALGYYLLDRFGYVDMERTLLKPTRERRSLDTVFGRARQFSGRGFARR